MNPSLSPKTGSNLITFHWLLLTSVFIVMNGLNFMWSHQMIKIALGLSVSSKKTKKVKPLKKEITVINFFVTLPCVILGGEGEKGSKKKNKEKEKKSEGVRKSVRKKKEEKEGKEEGVRRSGRKKTRNISRSKSRERKKKQ